MVFHHSSLATWLRVTGKILFFPAPVFLQLQSRNVVSLDLMESAQ